MRAHLSLLIGLLLLVTACSGVRMPPGPSVPPPAELGRADTLDAAAPWSYEELRAGALWALAPLLGYSGRERPPVSTISEIRVLAWHVTEDSSGLRVERALLWMQLTGEPLLWAVANLYRHPGSDTAWRPATATHTQYYGARLFVDPPRNDDVYTLLDINDNWRFDADPSEPFRDADLRERTWMEVIGEPPARRYPAQQQ